MAMKLANGVASNVGLFLVYGRVMAMLSAEQPRRAPPPPTAGSPGSPPSPSPSPSTIEIEAEVDAAVYRSRRWGGQLGLAKAPPGSQPPADPPTDLPAAAQPGWANAACAGAVGGVMHALVAAPLYLFANWRTMRLGKMATATAVTPVTPPLVVGVLGGAARPRASP